MGERILVQFGSPINEWYFQISFEIISFEKCSLVVENIIKCLIRYVYNISLSLFHYHKQCKNCRMILVRNVSSRVIRYMLFCCKRRQIKTVIVKAN
jgi:hypothetical protein